MSYALSSAAAAAGLLVLAGCAAPYGDTIGTPLEKVSDNYLTLWAGIPAFYGMTGSAVVVAEGVALTNRHVATTFDRLAGYSPESGWIGVEVTSLSERLDLAVLAVPRGLGEPIETASAYRGQRVWLMGTPALPPAVGQGVVVTPQGWACVETPPREKDDVCPLGRFTRGIVIKGHAAAGYSGGPVVDANGRLVALVQGTFTRLVDGNGAAVKGEDAGEYVFAYPIGMVFQELARLRPAESLAQSLIVPTDLH